MKLWRPKKTEKSQVFKKPEQLDLLIDLWKYQNYRHQGGQNPEVLAHLNEALLARAQLEASSPKQQVDKNYKGRAPHQAHGIHRLQLLHKKDFHLGLRYGFHSFDDPHLGYDEKSFISFFEPQLKLGQDHQILSEVHLLEILSLQSFNWNFPKFSWVIESFFDNTTTNNFLTNRFHLAGGAGISHFSSWYQLFILFNIKGRQNFKKGGLGFLGPQIRLGAKFYLIPALTFLIESKSEKLGSHIEHQFESNIQFQMSQNAQLEIGGLFLDQGHNRNKNTLLVTTLNFFF